MNKIGTIVNNNSNNQINSSSFPFNPPTNPPLNITLSLNPHPSPLSHISHTHLHPHNTNLNLNNIISSANTNSNVSPPPVKFRKVKQYSNISNSSLSKIQMHEIYINDQSSNKMFYHHKSNKLSTTKYNIFTFLPKSLIIQFARLPNIYFLATAIIQSIPVISPLSSASAIIPLVFVLSVSMLRELIEDLSKNKYDTINNKEIVSVYRNGAFITAESQTLQVGELIVLTNNSTVPADTVLLDSSHNEGICYVETGSLDGEKALKQKISNKQTNGLFSVLCANSNAVSKTIRNINISGFCQCDLPNADLHKLDGKLKLEIGNDVRDCPVTSTQLLLKGSVIKHTCWAIGFVLYTGMNNKIIMNSKLPRVKISQIESRMNKYLIGIFLMQMILCCVCAYTHHSSYHKHEDYYGNYVLIEQSHNFESFITFFTYLLLLNTLIPISLIVTMEIVKVLQGLFIRWDVGMYAKKQRRFCGAASVSLNEELGNVNYIFSDKTGTLTSNKMQFKYCIIGDRCYEYRNETKDIHNNKEAMISNSTIQNNNNINNSNNTVNNLKFGTGVDSNVHYYYNENGNSYLLHTKNSNKFLSGIHLLPNRTAMKFKGSSNISNVNGIKMNNNNNNLRSTNIFLKNHNESLPNQHSCNYIEVLSNNNNNNNKNTFDKETIHNRNYRRSNIINIGHNFFRSLCLTQTSIFRLNNTFITKIDDEALAIHEFWKALACAHECVCSESSDGSVEYSGVSPDDVELVRTAASQGYSLLQSPSNIRKVQIGNVTHEYEILNILNFSSERKRMSVVLKEGNNIKVYTKGADCEIKKRLSKNSSKKYFTAVTRGIDVFSAKGYRTLMIAEKTITQEEYEQWSEKLRSGEMNLQKKHSVIDSLYNEMEQDLLLLGATIVEDKLQDNVPETIRDLRLAGIKIWVLTGDKADTAENIALSCNLISKTHKNFKICSHGEEMKHNDKSFIDNELTRFLNEFREYAFNEEDHVNKFITETNEHKHNAHNDNDNNDKHSNVSNNSVNEDNSNINISSEYNNDSGIDANNPYCNSTPFSILIEAPILAGIFKSVEATKQFLRIALFASTVICCRVSPLQKSQVVKIVKEHNKEAVTLAIGDGGNDVSMIMEAHIGVGIHGEEGLRAVQASDFSIGEFQFLRRLLLFHGRANLNRISQMILYFFYKNFLFTITHFFFAFRCLGSGQTIIDDWFITVFNLVFTSLPLGVQACTDFDIREEDGDVVKEMMPFLYKEARDQPLFSLQHFLTSLLKGLVFGAFNFYIFEISLAVDVIDIKGNPENLWFGSLVLYTNVILSVSCSLMLNERFIIVLVPVVLLVTSFILYVLFCVWVHYETMFNSFASVFGSLASGKFYLNAVLLSGLCFVIEYSLESKRFVFNSNMTTTLMNLKSKGTLNNSDELPLIIQNAKMSIELITKYNNFGLLNAKDSFSLQASNLFKNGVISEEAFVISAHESNDNKGCNKITKAKSQRTMFHKGLTDVGVEKGGASKSKKGLTVGYNLNYDDKMLLSKIGGFQQEDDLNGDTMIKKQFSTGLKVTSNLGEDDKKKLAILEEVKKME